MARPSSYGTLQQVLEIYASVWGAAADREGADYWSNNIENNGWTTIDVADSFFDQVRVQAIYQNGASAPLEGDAFLTALYLNIFKVATPDEEGFAYWQGIMEDMGITNYNSAGVGNLVMQMIDGMWANSAAITTQDLYKNLIAASVEFYNRQEGWTPFSQLTSTNQAAFLVAAADLANSITPTSTMQDINNAVQDAVDTITGGGGGVVPLVLTIGQDTLVGTSLDDTFTAPVVQTNGVLANTLETGDVLNGGSGFDTLRADLIGSGSLSDGTDAPAISATTNEIERVVLRQQSPQSDADVNESTIDAEKMFGVKEWWTDNSRSDIQIEDIRSLPEQTTFGMRQTDPVAWSAPGTIGWGASLYAYFDPAQVSADRLTSIDSSLTLRLEDAANPDSLEGFPVASVSFTFNGETYTLALDLGTGAERTYAALLAAVQAGLAADPDLAGLTATLNADNTLTITDPQGGIFEAEGYSWIDNLSPPSGTLNWALIVGAPIQDDAPVETAVILDAVGRTSQGGWLDIGSMADGGVNVFNVTVDRSSWLTEMASRSDLGFGAHNLETVILNSTGANGDLKIGSRIQDETGELDGRVVNGLWDVQTVDSSAFLGDSLDLGIVLTSNAVGRYLTGATEEVLFSYTGSAGADNFDIWVDNGLSGDPDFALDVQLGAGDDRLNLDLPVASNASVDGGTGNNTIAVSRSHGTNDDNTFEGFANFQTYEVEGTGYNWLAGQFDFDTSTHDFDSMAGITSIVIATDGGLDPLLPPPLSNFDPAIDVPTVGDNTTLRDVDAGTVVTITGKNQTLGDKSDNDQLFGNIRVQGADGATFDLNLDNTARVDGRLIIDSLWVEDQPAPATNESAVRTFNLTSGGQRDASNIVRDFQGERVTTLNLDGTQDLGIWVTNLASRPVTAGDTPAATIDASELTGDLTLLLDAGLLDNDDDDVLIGTEGTKDWLALYGALGDQLTEISGFETIQFGKREASSHVTDALANDAANVMLGASGVFDATNVDGVTKYVVARIDGIPGALRLENLSGVVNVDLGDSTVSTIGQTLTGLGGTPTIEFAATGTGNTLNLNLVKQLNPSNFNPSTNVINVEGFQTINVDLDRSMSTGTQNLFTNFNVDDAARTLTLTGGSTTVDVTLNMESAFNTSLTTIDLRGFDGEFISTVPGWDSTEGSSARIFVNSYDFVFDIGGNNTQYTVPTGFAAVDIPQVETIDFTGTGFGNLAVGESITINFAGSLYTFTNTTAAPILEANLNAAIILDAANAPSGFAIANDGTGLIQLTASPSLPGDMSSGLFVPAAVVNATDAANFPGLVTQVLITPGDQAFLDPAYNIVTTLSDFVTSFVFTEDANDFGVVWQIDNFQAFDAGINVTLSNQSVIDLRALGVDAAADISIKAGDIFLASLTAADLADYAAEGNAAVIAGLGAGDTVITSNEGLDFTIVLTGVTSTDLSNENLAGIA